MALETNRSYIIEKLDALNAAIKQINSQQDDTLFAQSMRSLLVSRLEKERDRLHTVLPVTSALS